MMRPEDSAPAVGGDVLSAAEIDACSNGHPFTPENTRQRVDSGRACRTCRRETARRQEAGARPKRTGRYALTTADLRAVNSTLFWSKVNKTDTCWLWTGRVDQGGYGACFLSGPRTTTGAHRVAWALSGKEVDPGLPLDHLCRVRSCVNPAHLEPVTIAENNRRARSAR